MEDVYFLIALCRYMTHLKIDWLDDVDIELFLWNILNKMNHDTAADDQVTRKLDKMIRSEKQRVDY